MTRNAAGAATSCRLSDVIKTVLRVGLAAALVALAPARASAVEVDGLYQAEVIVTGQGQAERTRGFNVGFDEVVVKLTGDPDSARTPGVQRLSAHASDYVAQVEYADRMKGIPVHDEQGTRERSYYLRMSFDPWAMDEALQALGLARWGADRPRVMIWLGIKDSVRSYVLDSQSELGYGQREVLRSASRKLGVPIVLPAADDMRRRDSISYDDIARGDVSRLRSASRRYGADATLFATLVMDKDGYWAQTWSLDWTNRLSRYRVVRTTFDVSLWTAIACAAKRFSTGSNQNRMPSDGRAS
jgi:uncharacterized protein